MIRPDFAPDVEPDSQRPHGLTAIQTVGIIVACVTLLYALTAMLPGP
jgi:hypothetical protein